MIKGVGAQPLPHAARLQVRATLPLRLGTVPAEPELMTLRGTDRQVRCWLQTPEESDSPGHV